MPDNTQTHTHTHTCIIYICTYKWKKKYSQNSLMWMTPTVYVKTSILQISYLPIYKIFIFVFDLLKSICNCIFQMYLTPCLSVSITMIEVLSQEAIFNEPYASSDKIDWYRIMLIIVLSNKRAGINWTIVFRKKYKQDT